jgi:hypothetical protein
MLYLSKPSRARASGPKVEALLRKVRSAQVLQFVDDNPRAELEPYGLQNAEMQLVLGRGTNDVLVVQFGKSPTNDPTTVYARLMKHTNIVTVSREVLTALQISHGDLRDLHLLSFNPEQVDSIKVAGEDPFLLKRQTNGWLVTEPQIIPADAELVKEWLQRLQHLEGSIEKDVVTDYAAYGLAPAAREYLLHNTVTNSGVLTNHLLAQLAIGTRRDNKVFARGADESVYAVTNSEIDRLPSAAWQLRDRRVWTFTTNQVVRVEIEHRGYTRQLVRSPAGEWSLAPGSQGIFNTLPVEEMMFRLGELRAIAWVARGEEHKTRYGFPGGPEQLKLAVEIKGQDKPRQLKLEFSSMTPAPYPYALATVDGQSWIFEFPSPLFYQLLHHLGNRPLATAEAPK